MSLWIGTGKADITVYEPGMAMFGWGQPHNQALSVAMPLFARAVVLAREGEAPVALVNLDLGMVSQSLRMAVEDALPSLGLLPERTMLAATHTHSGPNGFSDHLFYAITGPGFSVRVHDQLVAGVLQALAQARGSMREGRGKLAVRTLPVGLGLAFNRSLAAHRRNPEVAGKEIDAAAAVNRRLVVLRLEDPSGRARACVSWFPLHGTCLHADNTQIHSDHPGICAERLERWAREGGASEDFVALCCQEAAGDSSPNTVMDRRRGVLAGDNDDAVQVEQVGEAIARQVRSLLMEAASVPELQGPVAGTLVYRDFAAAYVAPEHAGGLEVRTAPARVGLSFALGTDEGPGPLHALAFLQSLLLPLSRWRSERASASAELRAHGPKLPGWRLGRSHRHGILRLIPDDNVIMAHLSDPRVEWYLRALRSGVLAGRGWVPEVLPAQVLKLGELVIAAVPGEPTTIAGRRLRRAIGREREIVVVQGYANAYASYITTPEEYEVQHYEAASTLFGRWTLPAWCTVLSELRDALEQEIPLEGPSPPRFGARLPPMAAC